MFLEDYGVKIDRMENSTWYYHHGKLHREDGPAIESFNGGANFYILRGKFYTEKAWKAIVKKEGKYES
jgi:hypothetical protein